MFNAVRVSQQLRQDSLEQLLSTTNTSWLMVGRRWPEAPARFDELDQRQAGTLVATLRRRSHLPANHGLNGAAQKRIDANR